MGIPGGYLRVVNWRKYQHYHDGRRPAWIKLYVQQLRDTKLKALPITTRLLWDQLLLLAAEYENSIPNDAKEIANSTNLSREAVTKGLEELVNGRWLSHSKTRRRSRVELDEPLEQKQKQKQRRTALPAVQTVSQDAGLAADFKTGNDNSSGGSVYDLPPLDSMGRLVAELRDADENTPAVLRSFDGKLPPAAFEAARETVVAMRGQIRRESAYAVGLLNAWVEEGRYSR